MQLAIIGTLEKLSENLFIIYVMAKMHILVSPRFLTILLNNFRHKNNIFIINSL